MEELNAQPQAQAADNEVKTEQQTTQPEKIKVKFNHEEMELPLEEAVIHIQKGMNYDKVSERLKEVQEDIDFLEERAKEAGMSRKDFREMWKQNLSQAEIKKLAEEKEIPEDVAKELSEAKRAKQKLELIEKEKQIESARLTELASFLDEFPDVKTYKDIPAEVVDEWTSGTKLKTAYKAYQADLLKEKLSKVEEKSKVDETNQKNAAASMGAANTNGDSVIKEINQKTIKEMSSKEMKARWSEIQKLIAEGKIM